MIHPAVIKDMILGISLCIAIFATIMIFPLTGVFVLLFLPLPVLYFRLKLGRNPGGIIAAVSFTALMIMAQGVAFDILYFGALLLTGLILGECIERHLSIEKTMIYTSVGVFAAGFAVFLAYAGARGQTMGEIINAYLTQYLSLTAEIYKDMGVADNQIKALNSAFLVVMPGMFLASFLSTIWMNVLIIKKLLTRIGIELKSIAHLSRFKAPDFLVWPVIVLGLMLFLPMDTPKYVAVNCLIVLTLIYFFQGIAVVSFYFQKKNSPTALRVFSYSLIAVQIYVLLLVIGLGFFDTWIDFRKLGQRK